MDERDNERMRSARSIAMWILATLLLGAGCTSDKPAATSASFSSASGASASPSVEERSVTASPSSSLHDGDLIRVDVRGFDANERVWLSECASPQAVNMGGCGLQPAQQPFVDLDDHGEGSISFVVAKTASNGPVAHGEYVMCSDQCVLTAVGASGAAYSQLSFAS